MICKLKREMCDLATKSHGVQKLSQSQHYYEYESYKKFDLTKSKSYEILLYLSMYQWEAYTKIIDNIDEQIFVTNG
jgi:hypothetical protein